MNRETTLNKIINQNEERISFLLKLTVGTE